MRVCAEQIQFNCERDLMFLYMAVSIYLGSLPVWSRIGFKRVAHGVNVFHNVEKIIKCTYMSSHNMFDLYSFCFLHIVNNVLIDVRDFCSVGRKCGLVC